MYDRSRSTRKPADSGRMNFRAFTSDLTIKGLSVPYEGRTMMMNFFVPAAIRVPMQRAGGRHPFRPHGSLFLTLSFCLGLSACGSKPDCTSQETVDAIAKIAREQAAGRGLDTFMPYINLPNTTVGVINVRTRAQDDRHASCAGEMDWHLTVDKEKFRRYVTDNKGDVSKIDEAIADLNKQLPDTNQSMANPITYEVEKMDKGGVYVTVQGIFKPRR